MRILVCAAEAPVPPMNGFQLQLSHLCRRLGERHKVTILAYGSSPNGGAGLGGAELITLGPAAGSAVQRLVRTSRALLLRRPRRAETLVPEMSMAIDRLLAEREFDVVHVAGSALAGTASRLRGMAAVLAALDAWHLNLEAGVRGAPARRRPLLRVEHRNVRRFAKTAYRPFRRVVVVSSQDGAAIRELDPSLAVEVVPNGVDSSYFAPDPAVSREEGLVVFTGSMGWPPNAEAASFLAREVLPRLRAAEPHARLALVGRNPGPEVRALAALPGVEVTGEVSDVRPWLHRASAFACPMVSGTGIKNKLLEALACGVPSVATSLSCQGVRVTPGTDLLVADTAGEFANSLTRLLSEESLRDRLASAGRDAVTEGHDWEEVTRAYERIYSDVVREVGA